MLAALSAVAYAFVARTARETLEPLLMLPEGQAAYAATMRHVAVTIALIDLPLLALVAVAAYVLARVSVQPLIDARAREERFAADAAHELRTPLARIAAVAQAARDADAGGRSEALERIVAAALEASTVIADLALLARTEADDRRLYEPVDLTAVAARAVRAAAGRDGVAVACEAGAAAVYVSGDERALQRLIGNLIENGLRYARTRVAVVVSGGTTATLSVEDDGPGVSAGDRERIFERFYKADPAAPGSGLGLAICRRIARAHGATLELEGGARFVARFPPAGR